MFSFLKIVEDECASLFKKAIEKYLNEANYKLNDQIWLKEEVMRLEHGFRLFKNEQNKWQKIS